MDWRNHRDALGVIVALSVAVSAAPARAQDDVSPDGSTILFREGVGHLRAERYAEAVEAFRGSYRLAPRVTTMCNLALTYDRWGPEHREAAIRAYRTCAADDESGRYRSHALERITALERELALLGGDAPPSEGPSTAEPAEGPAETASEAPSAHAELVAAPLQQPRVASRDHTFLWVSIGSAGGAAIALVTAIALALDAQSRVAALEADVPDGRIVRGSEEERRLDAARGAADGATAAYVITAVLAAAAAGFLTLDLVLASAEPGPSATLRLTPAGLSGAF